MCVCVCVCEEKHSETASCLRQKKPARRHVPFLFFLVNFVKFLQHQYTIFLCRIGRHVMVSSLSVRNKDSHTETTSSVSLSVT